MNCKHRCIKALFVISLLLCLNSCGYDVAGIIIKNSKRQLQPLINPTVELNDKIFFKNLSYLLEKYGDNLGKWDDFQKKRYVSKYLRVKHGLDIGDCIFAKNLLGLGIYESPDKANDDLRKGMKDAWGYRYDVILASSARGHGLQDLIGAIGITQGVPLYNKQLTQKAYIVLKADLHSVFGEVFKNFNGQRVNIIASKINIIGAPGSASEEYIEGIMPALTFADCIQANIYLCENDSVPRQSPNAIQEKVGKYGINLPNPYGGRTYKGPLKKTKVNVIKLHDCGHNIDEYFPRMGKR